MTNLLQKTFWQRLLLILGGLSIVLVVSEVVARLVWTAPWSERLVQDQTRPRYQREPKNRWGLRDQEYAATRKDGVKRVLVLGDSFTYGSGVKARDSFPEVIERALRAEPPPNAPGGVEVLNGGIPGSLTSEWLELWYRVNEDFDPDVVLVVFFLRNGTTVSSRGFFDDIRSDIALRNQNSRLYRWSYLYRVVLDSADRRRISRDYSRRFEVGYFGDSEKSSEWHRARENMREIRRSVEDGGALFAFAVFPVLADLDDGYPFQRYVDVVVQFGRDEGFRTHDLLPDFLGRNAPDLWVSATNQHPNREGHEIAARSLLPLVRDLLRQSE